MFRRGQVVQDEIIARNMRRFFRTLRSEQRRDLEEVATSYGKFLWAQRAKLESELSRSRFCVALSIGDTAQDLDNITKRASLISDTLLLSHDESGSYRDIGAISREESVEWIPAGAGGVAVPQDVFMELSRQRDRNHLSTAYGIYCPDLDMLGQWILDAELLLRAGLVWYLPSYGTAKYRTKDGVRTALDKVARVTPVDYLIRDGRAVDASGANPIKSQLVRPVLRIDLPFLEGVGLRDFGKITTGEFSAYSAFRDFLRSKFLEMDTAMNDIQSDRELLKLGLQIKDHVRSARAQMEAARRKRAVSVTGAAIGSVGAILVAVYGPALAAAIAAVGASGGVWGILSATADNSIRALREDKWYYVWALAKKGKTPVL
ncbi:hypothetical protein ACIA5D_17000 [Actinoplanes sp. NPDC051513]|uniref:hypothetical protein n=1 Tax=Actinoplanes sp. NPDC051513 TaxID=3363908 RepID=UPI0037B362AB